MKCLKRTLSIAFLLAIIVGCLAFNASATEVIASGYCGGEGDGTNLSWTLDSEGTFTISGTGKMVDSESINSDDTVWEDWALASLEQNDENCEKAALLSAQSWWEYCSDIKKVVVSEGVTTIGDYAFEDCWHLTEVIIGNSVATIGDGAFSYTALTSVTIPDCVISIGEEAFLQCDSLVSATIGDSVTIIGDNAFKYCYSLAVVTVGDRVAIIGDNAFASCMSLTSVMCPDSVTYIGSFAFEYCESLTSVSIGNRVETIGDSAFSGCSNLTRVTIPNSVTTIGNYAFEYCTALVSVTIGNSVETIGDSAFSGCSVLTGVAIPNSVITIGNYAFEYCTALTSATIGNSVETIGDSAFSGCSVLTNITIPNSVTIIGGGAFSSCSALTTMIIGNSVATIGYGAFQNCSSLTNIVVPDSVTSIGGGAFSNCSALTTMIIGNSVATIGYGAFQNCSSLMSVVIPNSVATIEDWAFYYCSALTSVTIGDGVAAIGIGTFSNCNNLNVIQVAEGNDFFSSDNGVLFSKEKDVLVCYPAAKVEMSYTVPESVTTIGYDAFGNCASLLSVFIGNSVAAIEIGAFSGCSALTSVTIPNSVTTIGNVVFSDCPALVSVYFEGNAPDIGWNVFEKDLVTLYYISGMTGWTDSNAYNATAGTWNKYKITTWIPTDTQASYRNFGHLDACDHTGSITIDGTKYTMTEEFKNSSENMTVMKSGTYLDNYVYVAYNLNESNQITAANVMYGTLCALEGWDAENKTVRTDLDVLIDVGEGKYSIGKFTVSDAVAETFPSDKISEYIGKQVRVYTLGQYVFKVIPVTTGSGTVTSFDPLSTPQKLYIDGNAHPLAPGDNDLVAKAQTAQFLEMTYVLYDDTIVEIYDIGQTYLSVSINNSMGGAYYVGEEIYFFLYRVFEDTEGNLIYTEPKNYGINISDSAIVKQKMEPTSYGDSVLHVYKAEKPGHVAFEFSELNPDLSDKGTPIKLALTITEDVYKGYRADQMPKYNYDLGLEHDVYNFYVHGMYVSDFSFDAIDDETYRYTFNVYNERYNPGVVEVYNADGTLIDVEIISKTENSAASLKSLFDQTVGVFKDIGKGNSLSFRSSLTAKHTPISIDVPIDGTVIVTDSCAASDACLVANCYDLAMSLSKLMNSAITYKNETLDAVTRELILKILASDGLSNFSDELRTTVLENYVSEWTEKQLVQLFVGLSGDLTRIFAELDIDIAEIAKDTLDAAAFSTAQGFFEKATGPAGLGLKFVFAFNEATNVIGQVGHFSGSCDATGGYVIATPNILERSFEEITSKDNVSLMSIGSSVFTADQIMQSNKLSSQFADMEAMGIGADDIDIYDVRLFENGSEVEFTEEVCVKIPLEDTSTVYIAACYENGRWVPLDGQTEVKTDNGQTYMSLLTEDLGTFALISKDKLQAHTIRVISLDEGSVGLGSGFYAEGEDVTATAVPKDGYSFSCWMENGEVISTDASYTFKATSNRTLEAHYSRLPGFNLTLDSAGDDYVNVVLLNGDCKESSLQLILTTYDVHGRMIKCISRNEIIGESEDWEETITWDGNSDVAEIRGFVLDSVTKKPISPMWTYAIPS